MQWHLCFLEVREGQLRMRAAWRVDPDDLWAQSLKDETSERTRPETNIHVTEGLNPW
jgi:hypothetical protein